MGVLRAERRNISADQQTDSMMFRVVETETDPEYGRLHHMMVGFDSSPMCREAPVRGQTIRCSNWCCH